ncbi:MAG: hypothetical protein KAG20_11485, partial [Cocleimonas sp.]|nr:hypothetical protein [Cocleimonas sp.]
AKRWKELISNGWINRVKKTDKHGCFIGGFDYEIYDEAHNTESGHSEDNQNTLIANMEEVQLRKNRTHINTNSLSNTNSLNNTDCAPSAKSTSKRFRIPDIQEIKDYCKERNNLINAEQFFDSYESKGWMVGRTKMKDWKASVRTWERNGFNNKPNNPKESPEDMSNRLKEKAESYYHLIEES